ncbi:uncharacterized protein Thert_03055 [Thermoanaerobacterium thermosaccharolyticum]|uniref:Uncharacterized protein n=1 Tax=Thermoanaerobacterium thermosaccharolyticum TaxID=1517 RepID=A0A223I280_THETR|nr:uncharacterized protein Thert_03055 [Thermoanaerobacterium thermosaccharolyticum]
MLSAIVELLEVNSDVFLCQGAEPLTIQGCWVVAHNRKNILIDEFF